MGVMIQIVLNGLSGSKVLNHSNQDVQMNS